MTEYGVADDGPAEPRASVYTKVGNGLRALAVITTMLAPVLVDNLAGLHDFWQVYTLTAVLYAVGNHAVTKALSVRLDLVEN